ncbi:hypothetical protein RB213_005122 [Colletotrichum asianum]
MTESAGNETSGKDAPSRPTAVEPPGHQSDPSTRKLRMII